MSTHLTAGPLLTTAEVAELLRTSAADVRDLVAEGRLKARRVRPRGQLLFHPDDVREALREARPAADGAGDRVDAVGPRQEATAG